MPGREEVATAGVDKVDLASSCREPCAHQNYRKLMISRLFSRTAVQLVALGAITLAAYYHDLYGVARADQLIYFYRTAKINDFWNLTFGAFDFNRTHSIGDFALFRPGLYFLLGVEKWLWGYNLLAWQATSLGLHVAVVLSLFAYFRGCLRGVGATLECSWLPFAASAFFATLYAGSEMVAWQHLGGYLLFCLLLVQSAIWYRRFTARPSAGRAAVLVICATLAAFTYELGVAGLGAYALLCALAAMRNRTDRRLYTLAAGHLLLAIVAYAAIDYLDYPAAATDLPHPPIERTAAVTVAYARQWTSEMFLPAATILYPGVRITADFKLSGTHPGNTMIVVALVAASLAAQRNRKRLRDVQMAVLFLGLGIVYTATIVAQRALPRGVEGQFFNNSYYAYTFALLFLLAAFHFVAVPCEPRTGPLAATIRSVIVVALLLISAIGAGKIYVLMFNERHGYAEPIEQLIKRINGLVRQHRGERDFSFTVMPGCKGNPDLRWFSIQTTVKRSNYSIAWVMYPQYERDAGGKYLVRCDDASSGSGNRGSEASVRLVQESARAG